MTMYMGMTQKEIVAKAARLLELRQLNREDATREAGRAKMPARALVRVPVRTSAKAPVKKPGFGQSRHGRARPEAFVLSERAAEETKALRELKATLLRDLRPVDKDGVKPPVLRHAERKLRADAFDDTRNGNHGAQNTELVALRIQVQLLVMYQHKMLQVPACRLIAGMVPAANASTLRTTFKRYATDGERAYKLPYGTNGVFRRMTYREVIQELEARDVGLVGTFEPEKLVDSQAPHDFRCLKVEAHPDWRTVMAALRSHGSGCRQCGYIATGLKRRLRESAKAKTD